MRYGPGYENCQSYSARFRQHIDSRACAILEARPDQDQLSIVEVGAGQGDFLLRLLELGGERIKSVAGFDPAWRGESGAKRGGVTMYREYFSEHSARKLEFQPDIIVSRHTIEHVPGPIEFLENIRAAIGERTGVDFFVETPDIEWIVRNQAFEDVFYEHCSIFDPESLAWAIGVSGFANSLVQPCFDSQYLWASGRSAVVLAGRSVRAKLNLETIESSALAAEWDAKLSALEGGNARVVVWGAGAKGMTFAQIVDPDCRLIHALIDLNPAKQGRYIGRSGHVVVAPEKLAALNATHAIVMNPAYTEEISGILRTLKLDLALIQMHTDGQ